jgi:hypothetical protein
MGKLIRLYEQKCAVHHAQSVAEQTSKHKATQVGDLRTARFSSQSLTSLPMCEWI